MLDRLYTFRFEIFFVSQIAILFGSLLVPSQVFENIVSPIFFQINLLAGVVLLSRKRTLMWLTVVLLIVTATTTGTETLQKESNTLTGILKMTSYFSFYVLVTFELIGQVWKSKHVSSNIIFGLISGYISLGLIGFFICLSIELLYPYSFQGFLPDTSLAENLMYYSYITMLTIGYGDILPVTPLAQKAAMLIGLAGQIYLVVITAIVVGKYINQTQRI